MRAEIVEHLRSAAKLLTDATEQLGQIRTLARQLPRVQVSQVDGPEPIMVSRALAGLEAATDEFVLAMREASAEGYSLRQIAAAARLSPEYVRQLVAGKDGMGTEIVRRIAERERTS